MKFYLKNYQDELSWDRFIFGLVLFLALFGSFLSALGIWINLSLPSLGAAFLFSLIMSVVLAKSSTLQIYSFQIWPSIVFSLVGMLSMLFVAFMPPFTSDEIAYSAALPKAYAAAKQFFYKAEYGPYSAFPQNYEAFTTLSILIFDTPTLARLLNFLMGIGMVVAANSIALYLGVSKKIAWGSALLVSCSSIFIASVPISKNDIANAFFQVWAIVILLAYQKNPKVWLAIYLGILVGAAISVKYNSLFFAFIISNYFILLVTFSKATYRYKALTVLSYALFLMLLAFPWYLHNYQNFGNPLYPAFNQFFINQNNFSYEYVSLFKEMFYYQIPGYSWHTGTLARFIVEFFKQFGYAVSILGILGAIFGVLQFHNKKLFLVGTLAVLLFLITYRFGFWDPRYSFSLLVLWAALTGVILENILIRYKLEQRQLTKIVNLIILIICVVTIDKTIKRFGNEQVSYLNSKNQFIREYVYVDDLVKYIHDTTEANAKIATDIQMFYYLNRPYFHLHPLTEKGGLSRIKNSEMLNQLIRNESIDYLLVSDEFMNFKKLERTPFLNLFYDRLSTSINDLNNRGDLIYLKKIDNATFYKVNRK